LQPPHLFQQHGQPAARADGGITTHRELASSSWQIVRQYCDSELREFAVSAGERLEQSLSWGRQERGSPDRSANGEFRAMLLGVAEPGGGSLVQCHGGSASDCTAPPGWSQIVYTSISSCDLRRCPAPERGNPPDIRGVPSQTTACNRSPPAPPPRRAGPTRTREGGDPWHLPWERPGPRDRGVSA